MFETNIFVCAGDVVVAGTFALKNFRSRERKYQELSLPGTLQSVIFRENSWNIVNDTGYFP